MTDVVAVLAVLLLVILDVQVVVQEIVMAAALENAEVIALQRAIM